MAINPIALQTKAADFGGALNTLAAVRQLQAAGQQRQMNELAIQKAQRDIAQSEALKNALTQYDISTPEGQRAAISAGGTKGIELAKTFAGMRAAETTQQLNEERLAESRNKFFQTQAAQIKTPQDAARYLKALYGDKVLGSRMAQLDTLENAIADIPTDQNRFNIFVRQLAGGPLALENMYKEQSARALAKQSQDAAMARTAMTQQQTTAMNVLKNNARYDEVAGAWVANPGVSQAAVDQAQRVVNQGLMGMYGGGAFGQQPDLGEPIEGAQPSAPPLPPSAPAEGMPGTRTLEFYPGEQAAPTKLPAVPGQEATPTPLGQRGVLSQEELPNARMMAIENKATAQKRADLKINHPQTKTGLSAVMSEAEKTVKAIDRILTDPALQNVTGNWDGSVMMEGLNGLFSQASRNVQSDINFLKSRAFLGGVSKGIPGLAPLSDAESQGLQASEANLDIGQDTKKMGDSLIDYKLGIIRTANNKVREYNETFKDLGIPNWKPAPLYIPREAADQLLATRRTKAHINEFNKEFGEGAAEQVLKGATDGR